MKKITNYFSIYKGLSKDVYFIALSRFILGLGNFILPFAVLLFTDKLGYSPTFAGTLVMAVTGAFMLGGLIGGKLSDSFGHKQIMVAGEVLASFVLILCGFFSTNAIVTPIALGVAYFFVGIALPASNALVADHSTPANRDAVMSLGYLTYNLGSGVGPVVAGYLFWNYTAFIYWGNGLAILLGSLLIAIFVKNKVHIDTQYKDVELSNLESSNLDSNNKASEQLSDMEKHVEGTVWLVLKQRPRLWVFGIFCAMLIFLCYQMTMTSPLYYSHVFGKDGAVIFGQLMTFACLTVVVITPLLMKLTAKQNELVSLAIAGGLFALGYTIVAISGMMGVTMLPIFGLMAMQYFAWLFLTAGEVLLATKEGIYIANNSPVSHRGRVSSVLLTIRNLALMPTYVFMGVSIEKMGYNNSWLMIIGVAVVTVVAFCLMSRLSKVQRLNGI